MDRREQIPRFARDIEAPYQMQLSKSRMEFQLKIAVSHSEIENIIFVEDLEATSVIEVQKEIKSVLYAPQATL